MDAFVSSSKPKHKLLFESSEIKDRDSIFVAAIYPISSIHEAKDAMRHHRNIVHGPKKAAHEIAAWRYMALKLGKSGTGGPSDFEVKGDYDDDGEKYGGNRILKVMASNGIIDAVVIVSRWYVALYILFQSTADTSQVRRDIARTCKVHTYRAVRIRGLHQVQEQGACRMLCVSAQGT